MESVIRALVIYFVLLVLLRITGKRALSQITTFDFVVLLIISEATQQGLIGDDFSITTALLLVTTLIAADTLLSKVKTWFPLVDRWLDSLPVIVAQDGKFLKDRMKQERVDTKDVLESARELQGLEAIEQIKYAVLERSGTISIIPKEDARKQSRGA